MATFEILPFWQFSKILRPNHCFQFVTLLLLKHCTSEIKFWVSKMRQTEPNKGYTKVVEVCYDLRAVLLDRKVLLRFLNRLFHCTWTSNNVDNLYLNIFIVKNVFQLVQGAYSLNLGRSNFSQATCLSRQIQVDWSFQVSKLLLAYFSR